MLTFTATFDQTIVYFFVANLAALLACVLVLRHRARRTGKEATAITAAAGQFFRDSGGDVAVACVPLPDGPGYVAFIDTGSSKRYRYSHIVELILIDYVREKCGLQLNKVYWRFPIKTAHDMRLPPGEQKDSAEPAEEPKQGTPRIMPNLDDYLTEGMLRLKDVPGYEVVEASLESYREFADRHRRSGAIT